MKTKTIKSKQNQGKTFSIAKNYLISKKRQIKLQSTERYYNTNIIYDRAS